MKANKAAARRAAKRVEGTNGSAPQPANAQCNTSQHVGSQVGGSQPTKKRQLTIRTTLGVRKKQGRTMGKASVTLPSFGNGSSAVGGLQGQSSNETANSMVDCGYGLFL